MVVVLIHVDRRTDTAKVLGAFRDYENAPKIVTLPGLDTEHPKYAYMNAVF